MGAVPGSQKVPFQYWSLLIPPAPLSPNSQWGSPSGQGQTGMHAHASPRPPDTQNRVNPMLVLNDPAVSARL